MKMNRKTKALQSMKENKNFNLKTTSGYIYHVGGILNKLENGNHYIAIKGKWVQV